MRSSFTVVTYTLINDNFWWSKSSVKITLSHIFSALNKIEDLAIFNEVMVKLRNEG